jgi:hypothetical protein
MESPRRRAPAPNLAWLATRVAFLALFACTGCVATIVRGGPTERLREEEYRVWAAVLDEEAGNPPRATELIVDTLAIRLGAGHTQLSDPRFFHGLTPETVRALTSPDSAPVRISLRYLWRFTRAPILLTAADRRAAEERARTVPELTTAWVRFSRIAFSADRQEAVVEVRYFCGMLCGHQAIEILRRDQRGRWHVADEAGGVMF